MNATEACADTVKQRHGIKGFKNTFIETNNRIQYLQKAYVTPAALQVLSDISCSFQTYQCQIQIHLDAGDSSKVEGW